MLCVESFSTTSILTSIGEANPHAKRLYDDLLANYNRLIRPVSNVTDTLLVKLGLKLSQLIDVVSANRSNWSVAPAMHFISYFLFSQDLKNQVMTTNVWVVQVSESSLSLSLILEQKPSPTLS